MDTTKELSHYRVAWIDIAKAFGIILVVLGHIQFRPEQLNVWLCSFHMPLFFFLSGLTFNKNKYNTFKELIIAKSKSLLLPYCIFALFSWAYKCAHEVFLFIMFKKEINALYLMKQFAGIFIQVRTTDFGTGVWFLPCLFITTVLLYCIIKLSRGKIIYSFISSLICLLLGYAYAISLGG